jgi:hypothetical protein
MKRAGWRGESYRHYLASKGIRTVQKRTYMKWRKGESFVVWRTPEEDRMDERTDWEIEEERKKNRSAEQEVLEDAQREWAKEEERLNRLYPSRPITDYEILYAVQQFNLQRQGQRQRQW